MKNTKLMHIALILLLLNFGSGTNCLAQALYSSSEVEAIKQQLDAVSTKPRVRIQLRSQEQVKGQILTRDATSLTIRTGKDATAQPRTIAYQDIKTIKAEEKFGPGLKIAGVIVAAVIVVGFALLTHHRSR